MYLCGLNKLANGVVSIIQIFAAGTDGTEYVVDNPITASNPIAIVGPSTFND